MKEDKIALELNRAGSLCAWVGEKDKNQSRLFKRNMFSRVAQGTTIDLFECVEISESEQQKYGDKAQIGEYLFVSRGTYLIHDYDADAAFTKAIYRYLNA